MRNAQIAILTWVLGIGVTLIASWNYKKEAPASKQTWFYVMVFFIIALPSRAIFLDRIPITLLGDEGSAGLNAIDFINGDFNNIFSVGWFSFPALYFYIQSVSISILGQTTAALRITSVIAGALTVPAVYLLGRTMFNHRTGVMAGIFLAGFHFHIHFSRIGLNNIWDSLWFAIILTALWEGLKNENRVAFLIAGLGIGFAQYFYVTSRTLFILIPLWLTIFGLGKEEFIRRNLPNFFIMIITVLVIVLPLAWFYVNNPDGFFAPLGRVDIFGERLEAEMLNAGLPAWRILIRQMWLSARGIFSTAVIYFYTPGTPLLRTAYVTILLIGFIPLLLRISETRMLFLSVWVIAFIIIGGVSFPAPSAQRYVALAPALAIIVGFSLTETIRLISIGWRNHRQLITSMGIAIMVFLALEDTRFYLIEFSPRSDLGDTNTLVSQHLADEFKQKTEGSQVAFFGHPRMGINSNPIIRYLAPHIIGLDMLQDWGSEGNPPLESETILFVFLPEHERDLKAVLADYPGGQLREEIDTTGRLLYWYYEVTHNK